MTAPPAGTGSNQASAKIWPVTLAGFAIWCIGVLVLAPLKLDHDESFFLASGRILNEQAELYKTWIDFNTTAPPGIGRFSAWLGSVLHSPLDLTHKAVTLLLVLAGLGVAFAVALPLLRKPGPTRWVLAIGVPALLVFATPEFGRREHLMCVGVAGWVLSIVLAAQRIQRPWPVAIVAGLAAGLALYEKPHFILFGLALGVVDLIRVRGRMDQLLPSTWIAGATSIVLYVWLVLAHPDFLSVMLPATSDLYSPLAPGAGHAARELLATSGLRLLGVALAAFALSRQAGLKPDRLFALVACAFIASAVAIYIVQGLGFEYHRLPLDVAFNAVCLGLLIWGLSDGKLGIERPYHLGGTLAAAFLLLSALGSQLTYFARYPHRESVIDSPLLKAMRPPQAGDPILIITTDIHPAADVLTHLDVRWSGAFISHFPIAALIEQNGRFGLRQPLSAEKRQRWTPWFRGLVAERFCKELPVRVAVEISTQPLFFQAPGFDMLAWLREEPAFDACWRAAGLVPAGAPFDAEGHTFQVYSK